MKFASSKLKEAKRFNLRISLFTANTKTFSSLFAASAFSLFRFVERIRFTLLYAKLSHIPLRVFDEKITLARTFTSITVSRKSNAKNIF